MEAVNGMSEVDKGGPPAPSPLTGCYLLIVVGEPHSKEHKDIILRRIAKGLLSWDASDCYVDLEKELAVITEQAPEGEDARYGERLIQFASENLVTEILIHPAISTLSQCMKNLLSSFTRHRHVIHAGYTFAANGSWILQDGTFSLTDFSEAFQELEVQRVLRAYDNSISLDLHCSPEGDWTRLPKESFTKNCKVRVNPDDVLTSGSPSIVNFLNYISPFLVPTDIEALLESSDVVGNIRFSHPTLYVFPGGQGDAALFGINGFNMLVDGGFARKACFWDFVRHLDRLDAVLLTRLNNSNVNGISSVLRRKRYNTVYPQIGHFFCNIQERKSILSPDGDKDKDPLLINLLEEGQEIVSNLRQLNLQPQTCYRDAEPINLYHKVGHGTLDMYVLSPAKESKEVREFLQKWNTNDHRLFANQRNGKDFTIPTQNLVSICALLVWQPANANDSITRILFPGSTPQHKIFEGLDRLKQLECIKHPTCSAKTLTPSLMKSKQTKAEKIMQQEQKENKTKEKLVQQADSKAKVENKVTEENIKNVQTNGVTTDQLITEKIIKKHDSTESEKSGPQSGDIKKTENENLTNGKAADDKGVDKAKPKSKPKVESKVYKHTRSVERKPKPPVEKKASPTTPKKTVDAKVNGDAKPRFTAKVSPSATPAKSTKEANNRKVVESKYKVAPKKEPSKPEKKDVKQERKPISRRPKGTSPTGKVLESPVKKPTELHKVEARKPKLEKDGTTDSSTVSTPSADVESAMKKDLTKLTPEELEQLKARELAELKEEQEVVKEIEAVFQKSEKKVTDDSDLRKVKNISVDDKTEGEGEEYLIIEKEEIEHDSLDEKDAKESETQKHLRDSEESEKQRKLSGEIALEDKEVIEEKPAETAELVEPVKAQEEVTPPTAKIEDEKEQPKEVSKEISVTSPDEKVDVSSGKKLTDRDAEEEGKDGNILESQPDEKFSTPIESGATTAPTLPEDERIPLDEIKEDNGDQVIEEKHVKEDTKEKEIPIVQLPPKTTDSVAKIPTVVGIRLDKQTPIRDLVKTPDEVADLPVHEEVDIENYEHYQATHTPKQEDLKQLSAKVSTKTDELEKEVPPKIDQKSEKTSDEKESDKAAEEAHKEEQKPTAEKEPEKVTEVTIQKEEKPQLEEKREVTKKPQEEKKIDEHVESAEKKEDKPEASPGQVPKEEIKEELDVEKPKDDKVEKSPEKTVEQIMEKADEEAKQKEIQKSPEKTQEPIIAKTETEKVEEKKVDTVVEKESIEKPEIGKSEEEIEKPSEKIDEKKLEAETVEETIKGSEEIHVVDQVHETVKGDEIKDEKVKVDVLEETQKLESEAQEKAKTEETPKEIHEELKKVKKDEEKVEKVDEKKDIEKQDVHEIKETGSLEKDKQEELKQEEGTKDKLTEKVDVQKVEKDVPKVAHEEEVKAEVAKSVEAENNQQKEIVEENIIAIEKELVAVISDKAKDAEKVDEKADKPEKVQVPVEIKISEDKHEADIKTEIDDKKDKTEEIKPKQPEPEKVVDVTEELKEALEDVTDKSKEQLKEIEKESVGEVIQKDDQLDKVAKDSKMELDAPQQESKDIKETPKPELPEEKVILEEQKELKTETKSETDAKAVEIDETPAKKIDEVEKHDLHEAATAPKDDKVPPQKEEAVTTEKEVVEVAKEQKIEDKQELKEDDKEISADKLLADKDAEKLDKQEKVVAEVSKESVKVPEEKSAPEDTKATEKEEPKAAEKEETKDIKDTTDLKEDKAETKIEERKADIQEPSKVEAKDVIAADTKIDTTGKEKLAIDAKAEEEIGKVVPGESKSQTVTKDDVQHDSKPTDKIEKDTEKGKKDVVEESKEKHDLSKDDVKLTEQSDKKDTKDAAIEKSAEIAKKTEEAKPETDKEKAAVEYKEEDVNEIDKKDSKTLELEESKQVEDLEVKETTKLIEEKKDEAKLDQESKKKTEKLELDEKVAKQDLEKPVEKVLDDEEETVPLTKDSQITVDSGKAGESDKTKIAKTENEIDKKLTDSPKEAVVDEKKDEIKQEPLLKEAKSQLETAANEEVVIKVEKAEQETIKEIETVADKIASDTKLDDAIECSKATTEITKDTDHEKDKADGQTVKPTTDKADMSKTDVKEELKDLKQQVTDKIDISVTDQKTIEATKPEEPAKQEPQLEAKALADLPKESLAKSDITESSEKEPDLKVSGPEKEIEAKQIPIEKLDQVPLIQPSKIDEELGKQGEKDFEVETDDKTAMTSFREDSIKIGEIDKKLQELKEAADSDVKQEPADTKSEKQATLDAQDVLDKMELGRKSPKEREQDVAIIVASVAEVLKSDAPLEEFEGKIPLEITTFSPYPTYSTELRETHITTVESPIREEIISDKMQMRVIEEEKSSPKDPTTEFLLEERKIAPIHTDYDSLQKDESRVSSLIKDSTELIQATSKIISDIKQSSKVDDDKVIEAVDEALAIADEIILESKGPALEDSTVPLEKSIPIPEDSKKSSPVPADPKTDLVDSKTDIKLESSVAPEKLLPDVKQTDKDEAEVDKCSISSGKLSPDIKDLVGVDKSSIPSGKSSPEFKESSKEVLDVDKSPILSGRTTPEVKSDAKEPAIKEKVSDVKELVKDSTDKLSSVVISSEIIAADKTSPVESKEKQADACKISSGKTSPDIKVHGVEAKDLVDTDKTTVTSGKTAPAVKEQSTDLTKELVSSGKASPDVTELVKDSLDKKDGSSGKTTPEIKEPVKELDKENAISAKESLGATDTSPMMSGRSTPDVLAKDTLTADKSSIASGKSTPEIIEPRKDSLDIGNGKSPSRSGKSTPDIVIDDDFVTTGRLSPDSEEPFTQTKISEPTTETETVVTDTKVSTTIVKETTAQEGDKCVMESKVSSDIKQPETQEKPGQDVKEDKSKDKPETPGPSVQAKDDKPIETGKDTPDIKDSKSTVISETSTPERKQSECLEKPPLSGKASPDTKVGSGTPDIKDISKSTTISGTSTPERKQSECLEKPPLSEKTSPDTKVGSGAPDIKDISISAAISGTSTPDRKQSECLEKPPLSEKTSPDTKVQSGAPDIKDISKSTTISGTSTPERKQSECLEKPPLSGKTPPDTKVGSGAPGIKDISKSTTISGTSTPDRKQSGCLEKPPLSGKESPDTKVGSGADLVKTPSDSGKSSPILKQPDQPVSKEIQESVIPDLSKAAADSKKSELKDTQDPKTAEIKDQHSVLEQMAKRESIAGPSSSSKSEHLSPSKSPTEELELSRKSTPDIADVIKGKEFDESSTGRTTPPTVPVSPVVKEKRASLHEQEKDAPEVSALKTVDVRSSTPASDDCDISSGQVSRVLTAEEDDGKQVYSDDDDLPGSPLSATSQIAHSTSSQYDFEDSVKGIAQIDPMSTSFYGALPDDPVDLSKGSKSDRFLDEADMDFHKALQEHRETRGQDLTSSTSPSHIYEMTTAKYSSITLQEEMGKQQTEEVATARSQKESIMTSSFIGTELPKDSKDDPIASWGKPLGLPSPAPLNDNKGTPKKERKIPPSVMAKNKLNEDKKLSDSKYDRKGKKINPVYVDLTYVPHHGNSNYSYVEFFKRVRARYYVFSGIEPSKEVYGALLEAKQTWDDKELEVTIIPTYDTDVLGYWVAENEDLLAKYKIDLSPSASRCTINLQDHETSCSAYRLEFS